MFIDKSACAKMKIDEEECPNKCPICKENVKLRFEDYHNPYEDYWELYCSDCNFTFTDNNLCLDKESGKIQIIKKWNSMISEL